MKHAQIERIYEIYISDPTRLSLERVLLAIGGVEVYYLR